MNKPTNAEGLTFEEWCAAAGTRSLVGQSRQDRDWLHNRDLPAKYRRAWRTGEDPADFREPCMIKHFENQCPKCLGHHSIFRRHTREECKRTIDKILTSAIES